MVKRRRVKSNKKPSEGSGTHRNVFTGRYDTLNRPIYESATKKTATPAPSSKPVGAQGFHPGLMPKRKNPTREFLDKKYPLKDKYPSDVVAEADAYFTPDKKHGKQVIHKNISAIEKKHFGKNSIGGSVHAPSVRELLAIACEQRAEGLKGDDRDELISRGGKPYMLSSDKHRYLCVDVDGELGYRLARSLPDDTEVYLSQKMPGLAPSFVAVAKRRKTNFATIMLSKEDEDSDVSERIVTVIPGAPAPSRTTVPLGVAERFSQECEGGKPIPLSRVREIIGNNNFSVLAANSTEDIVKWNGNVDELIARKNRLEQAEEKNKEKDDVRLASDGEKE